MTTTNNFIRYTSVHLRKSAAILLVIMVSCSQDLVDDPIPFIPFPDLTISISSYPALTTLGVQDISLAYPNHGVRGIILYKKSNSEYLAFEKNCSLQPNDACATVEVHSSTLYMLDPCCGSTFNYEGIPTGGKAWRPLQQYKTIFNAGVNTLTITDEVL
jgi:hypothetical protein